MANLELNTKTNYELGVKVATREAYGKALLELGAKNPDIVVLDADLSGSTQTKLFANAYPERFFNIGIAENNMMGVAAGLARGGKIPFASSFAMFAAGRAWEFVRNSIAHNHLSVNICATHAGLTVGEDGASHQIIEDLALMRAIPGMTVIVPGDAIEAYQAVYALEHHHGPVYLRLGRAKVPVVLGSDYRFVIGKANIVKTGKDLTLVACGVMLHRAVEAANILSQEGVSVELINMATIKPIDAEAIIRSAEKTKNVITIEEHNIHGGLGDAVASVLAESRLKDFRFKRMGVEDKFGQSGDAFKLLDFYGLGVEDILKTSRTLLS